jgi:hypothetical protein
MLVKYGQASTSAPSAEKLNPPGGMVKRTSSLIRPHKHGCNEERGYLKKGEQEIRNNSTDIGPLVVSPMKWDTVYLNKN